MVVDDAGEAITAREVRQLLLVHPEPTADGLLLTGPDRAPLHVSRPVAGTPIVVGVWGARMPAALADDTAHAWFSEVVGRSARLVHLDDPTVRATDPGHTRPEDRVSFADGYPLLLTTQESLDALNAHIADGPRAGEGPLPMTRFRPNVVVQGAAAWAEDDWRVLRIGEVTFRAVKGCDRCVLTMLDPETAVKGMEPIATLARHRKWDGRTWFGTNLVPDTYERKGIRVGDEIEIISAVGPGEGPLR